MSEYTTEVRFICETLAGHDMSQGYGKVDDILDDSWNKVFDFDFPIFDEEYRPVLCKKILKHYYTREIGLETVGLWKLKLETKMQEIMPYYNKLYKTELLEYNPLYDADYTRTGNVDDSGENTKDDTGSRSGNTVSSKRDNTDIRRQQNDTSWNVYSDTPQGALTNVANETYLTDARKITGNRSNNDTIVDVENGNITNSESITNRQSGNFANTKEYAEHVIGKFPGKSTTSLVVEFRDSLLNIDMQIIDELNKLFMLVW